VHVHGRNLAVLAMEKMMNSPPSDFSLPPRCATFPHTRNLPLIEKKITATQVS
jgi:hypothetical protein